MATASQVVAAAASQVGYKATSTSGKFVDWYGMVGYWCAMFVSWVAAQVGATSIIPRHAYTPSGAQWFKDRGRWINGARGARRGDIAYFKFPGGPNRIHHVGIVESVRADGWLITIEGNTSSSSGGSQASGGTVARKLRNPAHVVGLGRPAYSDASAPASSSGGGDIRALQAAVGATPDNVYGPDSRRRFHALIAASRYGGHSYPYGKKYTQAIVGTPADGIWGKGSIAAHDRKIAEVQRILGVTPDGIWGPVSDAAFNARVSSVQNT